MQDIQERYASAARLDVLADELARYHGLGTRKWEYEEERDEVLHAIRRKAVREHDLDEAQSIYLGQVLRDAAG